jgi:hypothetical protein
MRRLILIISLVCLYLISCKKDNDSKHEFAGITMTDEAGSSIGFTDTTDWRTDDVFTAEEKELFDTINFQGSGDLKNTAKSVINLPTIIHFYPNPTATIGTFYFGADNYIINIVIVDNEFNIKISHRLIDYTFVTFTFEEFNSSIYRAYYVIQDMHFKIVGMGHGDIQKE